jgi:signal transduction histidine kinase
MNLRQYVANIPLVRMRVIVAAALLLLSLGLSRIVEYLVLSAGDAGWEGIRDEKSAQALRIATDRFYEEQHRLWKSAADLAGARPVLNYLGQGGMGREVLFSLVAERSGEEEIGIEVYDRDGSLAAWEGPSGMPGTEEVRSGLAGRTTSRVTRKTFVSYLDVSVPVMDSGAVVGAVVVRRRLESSVPLNDVVLHAPGMGEILSAELGTTVDFTFAGEGETSPHGSFRTALLYGLDSLQIGSVSVADPPRSAYTENVVSRFNAINAVLVIVLIVVCAAAAGLFVGRIADTWKRLLGATILIWAVRFALLWFDLPSGFLAAGIFDPAYFASKFGGGMAKSVGELSITVIALVINTGVLLPALTRAARSEREIRLSIPLRLGLGVLGTFFLFWLLRAFAAVNKSAVSDSTLIYFDGRVFLPSAATVCMIAALLLFAACVVAVSVAGALFLVRLCAVGGPAARKAGPWIVVAGMFLIVAALFSVEESEPLISEAYRFSFGAGILLLAFFASSRKDTLPGSMFAGAALTVIAAAGIALYPLLNEYSHEKDKSRIAMFAAEELKPVDSWLKNVVDEGLDGFDEDEYRERLSEGFGGDVSGIAFRRWTTSLACSQGYDAMFTVTDPDRKEASKFVIGASVAAMTEADTALPMTRERTVRVRDIGAGVNALKVYSGVQPIFGSDSTLLGYARVVVAAGQHSLFRGETPVILRGSTPGGIESFYRHVVISEYRDGVLFTSNDAVVPINHPLPEEVVDALSETSRMSLWSDDECSGARYETYFVRRGTAGNDVVALGLRDLGIGWHVVNAVKLFAMVGAVALMVVLCARLLATRRKPLYRFGFRGRLLLALLITAIVPMILLALYLRYAGEQRRAESIDRRLDEETQNVLYNITDHPEPGVTILSLPADRYAVEVLASDMETDFNVYTDRMLRASSKQPLYDVGILDGRLSGEVYSRILLSGARFVTQTEKLGSVEYTVGYRPILDARGDMVGIVSVPTLFQPEEKEDTTVQRNAFLAGGYAMVLVLIVGIASLFANRIAAPIQRLTEATRKVAKGDLEIHIPHGGADGEINDLIAAFEQMTRDLQKSRDELVAYERELAWKEMAKQVAHEIKNPLTPMRLSLQHIRRTYRDNASNFGEVLDAATKTVLDQIEALSRIASEFSRFAHMPRRTLARLDVNEVIREAVQLFQNESRLAFTLHLGEGPLDVLADREELRRAFINIIRNGIQAIDESGSIAVTTEREEEGIGITIIDTGKGVPEDIKPRLFEPNFSTKTDGMGLGLAIVKQTLDALGGTVTLESREGEGTTVTMWLPEAGETPEKTA